MTAASPSLPAGRPRATRRRFASLRTIAALMLREMSTTYGRSPGGYIWAVLEPVAGTMLLSLVFSAFLRNPALGSNFPLFYASGIVPFTIFIGLSNVVAQSRVVSCRSVISFPWPSPRAGRRTFG